MDQGFHSQSHNGNFKFTLLDGKAIEPIIKRENSLDQNYSNEANILSKSQMPL